MRKKKHFISRVKSVDAWHQIYCSLVTNVGISASPTNWNTERQFSIDVYSAAAPRSTIRRLSLLSLFLTKSYSSLCAFVSVNTLSVKSGLRLTESFLSGFNIGGPHFT